ncbi:MAG TPA: YciI family protein [Gemmatimonadales bacterium]|nr:YciI family protein [Gemmatimonadales bacterium]
MTTPGDTMPHYLISGYLPENFDPSSVDEAMIEGIYALNREMIAAGVRRFAGGLGQAHTLRTQPNGEILITDGPYLETKELVGGITIVETATLEEALEWARKGAKVGRNNVEVREIFFNPAPES